jgi:uncharacterized protein (TIGR03437 family)
MSLGGVQFLVGGLAVPIAGVSPTDVTYPGQWDLPSNAALDIEVWNAAVLASPFVPGFQVTPASPAVYLIRQPSGPFLLTAVHQDFSALVSSDSPAHAGETIHVYAHDLGPVSPVPPAGLPAPLQPLSLLTVSLACTFGGDTNPNPVPVNVAFAGLAPALLNVFQVDVTLPDSFQSSPSRLLCQLGDPSLGQGVAGFIPVQ